MKYKGEVVNNHGQATNYWNMFPLKYKRLFREMYPGSLNVQVIIPPILDLSKKMTLEYPKELFKTVWKKAPWRRIEYYPATVNDVPGFLIILHPSSVGRPPNILEFILTAEVMEKEVEIEIL